MNNQSFIPELQEIYVEIDELFAAGFTREQIEEIEAYRGCGYSLDAAIQAVVG